MMTYIISFAGMLSLLLTTTDNEILLFIFIMGGNFGVNCAFNLVFIGTYYLFPTSIVATAFGICNIFARVATIFSPYVAEIKPDSIS